MQHPKTFAGIPPYRMSLLAMGHFSSDFYMNVLTPLLPFLVVKLDLSMTVTGLLILIQSLTGNIMQPVFGFFLDRKPHTYLIVVSLIVSALFLGSLGLSPSLGVLAVLLAIGSLGSALFHPLGSTIVPAVTATSKHSLAMSLFVAGGNFGFALSPLIITFFIVQFGLSSSALTAIPGVVLAWLYVANRLHCVPLTRHRPQENSNESPWYANRSLLLLNIIMGLRSWVQVALPTFLPIYWTRSGLDAIAVGHLLTAFLMGGAIGGLIGGYVGDRFGKRICVLCAFLLCLPITYAYFAQPIESPLNWLFMALSGACLQGTVPSSIIWAQQLIPRNAAMASGMMLGLSFGLGGLGTTLTGILADHIGIFPALQWSLVPLVLAALLILTVHNPAPTGVKIAPSQSK